MLDALRIPVVEKPGYEADDVIGTLTTQARAAGMEVVISTGDRDAFQLVDEHVTVLYPVRGVSEVWRMTPEAVEAKYFVPPSRYRDKAALVGETSDNLPGVPGVGDKTAAKWIKEYGGLDGVIANVDKIKGKAGENLRAHLADVMRNYEINKLVCDLELSLRPEDARWAGWDREAVHQVFDALEFRVLRERLYQYLDAVEPEAESGFDLDGAVLAGGEVVRVARVLRAGGHVDRRRGRRPVRPGHRRADRRRAGHRRRPGRLVRPRRARRGRRGRGGGLARRPSSAPRCCTTASRRCSRSARAAGSCAASAATPRSPPTWPGPTSAPTTSPTWRCATCTASCASTRRESGQLTLDGLGDDRAPSSRT